MTSPHGKHAVTNSTSNHLTFEIFPSPFLTNFYLSSLQIHLLLCSLRAIIEDNRVLKEQTRRQRQQLKEYENTISSQNDQVLRLQDELKKLRVLTQGRNTDEKTLQVCVHVYIRPPLPPCIPFTP